MSSPHHRPLRLGTRGSPLALAQAKQIARQLRDQCGRSAVLITVTTPGDESTAPIERLGTTGVFTTTVGLELPAVIVVCCPLDRPDESLTVRCTV